MEFIEGGVNRGYEKRHESHAPEGVASLTQGAEKERGEIAYSVRCAHFRTES